jgi:hypothetical protein
MAEDFNEEKEEIEISDAEKISVLLNKVKSLEKLNKSLNNELKRKYSIFYPKSSRMLTADYPEFKKVREFKDINRGDLLFVWYFACEGSPLIDIQDDKERTLEAMMEAYKKPDIKMQEKYLAGNFPEKVKIAISKMKSFKIGPRVMAKRMMENTLNNWREVTDIDASDDSYFTGKDGVDWAKKKAFIEAGATISKNIGSVLSQVEGSYAVSEKEQEKEVSDFDNLIEDFHDSTN